MPHAASELHVPRPLEDYVVAYRPQMAGYQGLSLLPQKAVRHRSDQFRKENKGNLLRKHDLRIGANGRKREVTYKMDASGTYATITYGDEVVLDREEMADADSEIQYQQRQIDHGLVAHYTNIEYIAFKDILRTAASWGSNTTNLALTPTKQYDQHFGTGNPIEDFLMICDRIEALTGFRPNTITMASMTWTQIATHPAVLARGENQMGGMSIITPEQFERLIRVAPGTIKVAQATYNVAIEGATDDFRTFIGPDILFAYNDPAKINTFGLGQTFMYSGAMEPGAGLRAFPEQANDLPGANIAMRAWDEPWRGSDGAIVISLVSKFDMQLVNNNAGWLLRNAVDGTNTALYSNFLNN